MSMLRTSALEASVRQTEIFHRLDRGAFFPEADGCARFGRVGRALSLFAYAGIGWGLMVAALFALADIL